MALTLIRPLSFTLRSWLAYVKRTFVSSPQLAAELNVHAAADGSAEQNIALHKAVMQKLADNGGIVPDSLRN
jgi:predicted GNAT superfamily acetyltransferase